MLTTHARGRDITCTFLSVNVNGDGATGYDNNDGDGATDDNPQCQSLVRYCVQVLLECQFEVVLSSRTCSID